MDQKKTGQFIASLRRGRGLTQEQLGERLGVTNKTVSRWETGAYMPDIGTLVPLAEQLGVSVNELLCGERLSDAAFRRRADENLVAAVRESAFSLTERRAYWIRKWRREHIPLFAVLAAAVLALAVVPWLADAPWCAGFSPLAAAAAYAWQNNRMMACVEARIFGDPPRGQ